MKVSVIRAQSVTPGYSDNKRDALSRVRFIFPRDMVAGLQQPNQLLLRLVLITGKKIQTGSYGMKTAVGTSIEALNENLSRRGV